MPRAARYRIHSSCSIPNRSKAKPIQILNMGMALYHLISNEVTDLGYCWCVKDKVKTPEHERKNETRELENSGTGRYLVTAPRLLPHRSTASSNPPICQLNRYRFPIHPR